MTDEELDLIESKRRAIKDSLKDLKCTIEAPVFLIKTGREVPKAYSLNMVDGYCWSDVKKRMNKRMRQAVQREIIMEIIELVNEVKEVYPEWEITDETLKKVINEHKAQIPKDKEYLEGVLGILEKYSNN